MPVCLRLRLFVCLCIPVCLCLFVHVCLQPIHLRMLCVCPRECLSAFLSVYLRLCVCFHVCLLVCLLSVLYVCVTLSVRLSLTNLSSVDVTHTFRYHFLSTFGRRRRIVTISSQPRARLLSTSFTTVRTVRYRDQFPCCFIDGTSCGYRRRQSRPTGCCGRHIARIN